MYPEGLSPNDQLAIEAYLPLFRSDMALFARLVNNFRALNNLWTNGGIGAINGALQAGDIIPDHTGLAGAQPLTAQDIAVGMTAVQSFLTSYDQPNYEAYFVRVVGPANASAV